MDPLLLNIVLTPPPDNSSENTLATITLDYKSLTPKVGLLTTAAIPSEKETNELRWYLEEYWQWPYEQFLERAKKIEHSLTDIGKRLYQAVFESADAQKTLQAWRLQPNTNRQISIKSDMPHVLSLPWELLHDEQGFLALRTRHPVSIVRELATQTELPAYAEPFELPLRILLVTARPDDAGFVDPRSIARELLSSISEQVEEGRIELEFLRPPTVAQLRTRLSNSKLPPIHILHFDGHGAFGKTNTVNDGLHLQSNGPQGMLAFENENGTVNLIAAEELAQVLQDSGVKLAVFNACQSAVVGTDVDAIFSSVATRMIQSGIDGVVAMSASVLVAAATRYVKAFYKELADGTTVPTSQERARQALHVDPRRHLTRRTQDEEGEPVRLRDWWLPHYYQQRPVVFEATPAPTQKTKRKKSSTNTDNPPLLSKDMPKEPRYGFTGRALELLKIERALLQRKLVVISRLWWHGQNRPRA